jgi:hypothetical protein
MNDTVVCILGVLAYLHVSLCIYLMAQEKGEDNLWFAFVPILDLVLLPAIADMPLWWLLLFFVPCVNCFAMIPVWMSVARTLGKPSWLGLLMAIPGVNLVVIGYLAFSA